jgi:hypothetical protein
MPSNLSPAEFYRREADRLTTMAESSMFADVAGELLSIARHYDRLTREALATEPAGEFSTRVRAL